MIIGDWNANVNNNAIFGAELISFCEEHGYIISDVDKFGLESGAFTYLSESHGTTSWIDHCVCTVYALYRHTLPFQVWKSIMTYRARIIIRYLYV